MGAGYRAGVVRAEIGVIYTRDTYLFVKSIGGMRKLGYRS